MNAVCIVSQTSGYDHQFSAANLNILFSFTVGCKTEDGLTVILVERGPGVETRQIKTSYSTTAGTAYITFDNVHVPVENTLGEEGRGIFVILRYVTMVYDVRLEHSFVS
jgi:alkylation response protein AidB-like acyl-CoA dehydrogenase